MKVISPVKIFLEITAPAPLTSILVNLCQHDVLALKQSDKPVPPRRSRRSHTSHSVEFLGVEGLSERDEQ